MYVCIYIYIYYVIIIVNIIITITDIIIKEDLDVHGVLALLGVVDRARELHDLGPHKPTQPQPPPVFV